MILPPATLGLLGGGQLGSYFVMAAHKLRYRIMVLDPDPHSSAGHMADEHVVAAYDDLDALDYLSRSCEAVTTEFENMPVWSLAHLAKTVTVRPGAEAVALCQNRSAEKAFLKLHGFPHTPYADIRNEAEACGADDSFFPGILKVARFGYDGKSQVLVQDRNAALAAFRQFNGEPCILERMLPLDIELSVVLARDESGQTVSFPVSENHHRNGTLDVSVVPANASGRLMGRAMALAEGIARKMDFIGVLAVEFFVVNGQLYVNEMAPRPHNSGHYTLDACVTNQFEQQVRALCGLSLGEGRAHSAAVMVNLLGDLWYLDDPYHASEPDWNRLLSVPNLKLHLYGKLHARMGRKMGHFTVLGEEPAKVYKTAMAARLDIGICDE